MHPGPINRGVEIDGALADDPERSLIMLQVEMGVAVRMACLDLLTAERERLSDLARGEAGPARRPATVRTKHWPPARFSDSQRSLASPSLAKPWTDRR